MFQRKTYLCSAKSKLNNCKNYIPRIYFTHTYHAETLSNEMGRWHNLLLKRFNWQAG